MSDYKFRIMCTRWHGKLYANVLALRMIPEATCIVPEGYDKSRFPEDVRDQVFTVSELKKRGLM